MPALNYATRDDLEFIVECLAPELSALREAWAKKTVAWCADGQDTENGGVIVTIRPELPKNLHMGLSLMSVRYFSYLFSLEISDIEGMVNELRSKYPQHNLQLISSEPQYLAFALAFGEPIAGSPAGISDHIASKQIRARSGEGAKLIDMGHYTIEGTVNGGHIYYFTNFEDLLWFEQDPSGPKDIELAFYGSDMGTEAAIVRAIIDRDPVYTDAQGIDDLNANFLNTIRGIEPTSSRISTRVDPELGCNDGRSHSTRVEAGTQFLLKPMEDAGFTPSMFWVDLNPAHSKQHYIPGLNRIEFKVLEALATVGIRVPKLLVPDDYLRTRNLDDIDWTQPILMESVPGKSLFDLIQTLPFESPNDPNSAFLVGMLFDSTIQRNLINYHLTNSEVLPAQDRDFLQKYCVAKTVASYYPERAAEIVGRDVPDSTNQAEHAHFLEEMCDKMPAGYAEGYAKTLDALKVASALGIRDERFIEVYSRTIGGKIQQAIATFGAWIGDDFPKNRHCVGDLTVGFDKLPRSSLRQEDDAFVLDCQGLALPDDLKNRFVEASCALYNIIEGYNTRNDNNRALVEMSLIFE
ncbi:MAG: hypothetical protein ABIG95_01345, partial [Candidatus Woesearchaeota archaeon]